MYKIDPALFANTAADRLLALRRMAAAHPRPEPLGTNTHVHTNYSFSAFRSHQEAVWLAYSAGVEVFGINDHYTVDGHCEFAEACAAVHLPATFSIEAVAMDRDAEAGGLLLNDPGNPGRIYLCGKGVTQAYNPTAGGILATLRQHQEHRNRLMVEAVDRHFRNHLGEAGPPWSAIVEQTPLGNTTERHIARAIHGALLATAEPAAAWAAVIGGNPSGNTAQDQNTIRSALLKAGKPCFIDEDPKAYPALPELRTLYLHLGAIPTYPVLGNPITGGEEDLTALCDRLDSWGIQALELIPHRNTEERVAAVLEEAARRDWPVFDGTEHNTPVLEPLLTRWGSDQRFRGQFRDGALTLLGHQALCARGELGYVDGNGQPVAGGLKRCIAAGDEVLQRCK